jgi:hypothetical protein
MANTYTLIASNTLGSSAASVTFSAIPSTYTDLVVRLSLNNNSGSVDRFYLIINNDTGNNYSLTRLVGDGSVATSTRQSGVAFMYLGFNTVPSYTNIFGSSEIYIPNYATAAVHPVGSISVGERNASEAFIVPTAGLYNSATAITQLEIKSPIYSFTTGSSFYLYGIKNS